MAYFIFQKDRDGMEGTLYRIAENESSLNNLNIEKSHYKIIEETENNFNLVKYSNKSVFCYNQNIITYKDEIRNFTKKSLEQYINNYKKQILNYLDVNKNHALFNIWNDNYNQLDNFNLNSIEYPFNKSLEQHFKDQNLPSFSPLQIP